MVDKKTVAESQTRLLQRIAGQDRQALAEYYDQMAPVLFSTSARILGDAHEAEEVIQDVFVQIWNKAQTYDVAMGSPFSWTLSITRNRSIDRLRSRQRRVRLMDELENAADENGDTSAAPIHSMLGEEEIAGIRSAVNELPREQREAIEMAFFGGMTHMEIAVALKEPLGTVKARIRRGMLKLRDTLQPYL